MKKLVFIILIVWIGNAKAQIQQSLNLTFSVSTEMNPFQDTLFCYGLSVSGSVELYSENSLARVLLVDMDGKEHLVLEYYPLLLPSQSTLFLNQSEETALLERTGVYALKIELVDAQIFISDLEIDTLTKSGIEPLRKNMADDRYTQKIDLINQTLSQHKKAWVAGENSIGRLSHEEKKKKFGIDSVLNLQGFEYFVGGFFSPLGDNTPQAIDQIVDSFDWRSRHGADNPNSPYYNPDGHGWITPRINGQAMSDCWAFSSVYSLEAIVNLYYNRMLNYNLSEMDAVVCSRPPPVRSGGSTTTSLAYMKNIGVVNEECFPYRGDTTALCLEKCNDPAEQIKITNYSSLPRDELEIKKTLIEKGPLVTSIYGQWGHAMSMVGYGVVKAGDLIMDGEAEHTGIEIRVLIESPDIGKPYYIFKQSWGDNWEDSPFIRVVLDVTNQITRSLCIHTPLNSLQLTDTDIACNDFDGDGYYYWGIGPKPATCPACAPDEPDGDDSNPNLGPMDEYGICAVIIPLVEDITTSQTWSTDRTLCNSINIQSGVTLTITNTATIFSSNYSITIKNGGELILSEGTIDDGSIEVQSGGKLTIVNNGKILLGSYDNLDIQLGAEFDMDYGEINLK